MHPAQLPAVEPFEEVPLTNRHLMAVMVTG
jgi:hypothetical protein